MKLLKWSFWVSLILITACQTSDRVSDLPQDEFIQVYFNQRESDRHNYQDPYRQIQRGGDNLEAVILQEITAAKSSIDLAVQELNLPLVAQALVKSHRSGVRVRVILENNYRRSLSSLKSSEIKSLKSRDRHKYHEFLALVDRDGNGDLSSQEIAQGDALLILQQAGIPLLDDTADGTKGSGLMHHKFMVIDEQVVLTGSANFTLSGLFGDFDDLNTRGNVNHLLRIDHQEVAALFLEEFNYMWGDGVKGSTNSQFGLAKPWRSPVTFRWNNTQVTIQFAPTSPTKNWHLTTNGLIGKIISDAHDSLKLALFVFSDQTIAKIVQQKQEQGITVSGIFDSGFAFRDYSAVWDLLRIDSGDRCSAITNSNPQQEQLQKTIGVANLPDGDKLHHKFALIDRQTVISGSQNWSSAGNNLNDEVIIVIRNGTVAQHFDREFQRLSHSVTWGLPPRLAKCKSVY